MNIMVTGGLGYIGSLASKKLENTEHNITIIDKELFETNYNVPEEFNYLNYDIYEDFDKLKDVLSNSDVIIHLAAIVGEPDCQTRPIEAFNTNYTATTKLVDLCEENNIKLVFASTCSVYGKQKGELTEEDDRKPVGFYGHTKVLSEKYIEQSDLDCIRLRFGTVYGLSYRNRFDLAMNKFVGQVSKDKPITIYGGGQNRPFISANKVAEGVVWSALNLKNGVYNLASENFSIKNAGERIAEQLEGEITITENPEAKEDDRNYVVSNQKIKDKGFNPNEEFEENIQELYNWIIENDIDFENTEFHNHLYRVDNDR